MKKLIFLSLLVFCGFLFGQEDFLLLNGNYGDVKLLRPQTIQNHDFTFARLIYNGRIPGYIKNWYTDYPTGDENLIKILRRTTNTDIAPESRAIPITNPDLFSYPFVYSAEAGQMILDDSDAKIMREYLKRGGFWMLDDFWGTFEWSNFETEMKKVFPELQIQDIPIEHPIFHTAFDIEKIIQVPNIGYAYGVSTVTWEQDGYMPYVRGIFDDKGRLMVVIFFNTDTMDASEWADDPRYPGEFSTYAYKIFINSVIYAMTHQSISSTDPKLVLLFFYGRFGKNCIFVQAQGICFSGFRNLRRPFGRLGLRTFGFGTRAQYKRTLVESFCKIKGRYVWNIVRCFN